MAIYVIGDVQGCYQTLRALLAQIKWSLDDELWCVGDLVNRGPQSLDVLRWVRAQRGRVKVTLGNHDLHLLACHAGATQGDGDTLDECLSSSDRGELMEWLRAQPVLYEDRGYAMVHAAINPRWSWREARQRAREVERGLQSQDGLELLAYHHPSRKNRAPLNTKNRATLNTGPPPQWIGDLEWFTRARMIDEEGHSREWYKGSPSTAESGLKPWFESYEIARKHRAFEYPQALYFGHWAALGLYRGESVFALDSGCIWGRYLSALRLDDGALFQHPTLERALIPKNQRSPVSVGVIESKS
jgi:bis(5'-nucleosyl)-tetraphosphatase (symmetrical)